MDERDRILQRVQKLLALRKSDNPHEAAAAAATAQRLIERHAIAGEDLRRLEAGPVDDGMGRPLWRGRADGRERWRMLLLSHMAPALGCFCYMLQATKADVIALHAAGLEEDLEVLQAIYGWCAAEIERLAAAAAPFRSRSRERGFFFGAVTAVAEEIAAERARTRAELGGQVSDRALVVFDDRVERARQALGGVTEGGPLHEVLDRGTFEQGYRAAEGVYTRGRRRGVEG